ncbi:ribosome maturation factor RimM [Marivirga atlantica]|jgi:16S rRNA processing protein RimM|uniref:Ribosome maturation factor RimM n=1 Tax=Marivirga atlantica TaxID=1548457 RepID=A0A937AJ56_9BACT|nr:ribosome maturation factor RimM [Marivirga atlantica]MBL0763677.1 16S rRNA processing protein RimM [Marivirga atlantica]
MKQSQCFELGVVLRPHGLHGEVYISLDTDFPEDYAELESVFVLQNGMLVPFFIEHIQVNNKQALVKFEDIDSKDDANTIKGLSLHLPLDQLPKLSDDQFYFHEIIGFKLIDENKGELGTVGQVYEAGHQDLIGMDYKGKEVLIPINDEIINKVDRNTNEIFITLPEGLLELYLED